MMTAGEEFDAKRRHILEYVRLGLDVRAAMRYEMLSEEESENLSQDLDFQIALEQQAFAAESEYLHRMQDLIDSNCERGVSVELRWMLEKRWPQKYGNKFLLPVESPDLPPPVVQIRPAVKENPSFEEE